VGVLLGQFQSEPDLLKATAAVKLEDLGRQHAQGRDLARACIECHGPDLKGSKMLKSPDLTMAASYDPADFEKLLRTGVAAGDRKVGLMTQIAPERFNILSSGEIAALHGYLKARAQRQVARADFKAGAAQQR
jgi:mono/diheme cytochrome c family protein